MFHYCLPSAGDTAGFAIVADRFVLVADASIGVPLARRLWEVMIAPGAAFEDVLTAIAERGIETLPDFALVELVDAGTRSVSLAVRGRAGVDLFGPDRSSYAGGGVGTWIEGSAQRVSRLSVVLGAEDEGRPALPLARGVVRANRIELGREDAAEQPAPAPERPAVSPDDAAPPAWAAGVAADPSPAPRRADPSAPATPDETLAVDRSTLAELVRSAQNAAPSPRPAAHDEAVPEPAPDESTELGTMRRRTGRIASAPPAPPRYVLRLGDDRTLDLDRPIVLGRSPRAVAYPTARIEVLASPRKEVSGSDLEVRLDESSLFVRDLDSTNGTIVRHPDGSAQLLRGGASIRVPAGTILDIGDGNIAIFDADPAR